MEQTKEQRVAEDRSHTEVQRIELRSTDGPLLGVLTLSPLRIEVKRGKRVFEVDLMETMRSGEAIVSEKASE